MTLKPTHTSTLPKAPSERISGFLLTPLLSAFSTLFLLSGCAQLPSAQTEPEAAQTLNEANQAGQAGQTNQASPHTIRLLAHPNNPKLSQTPVSVTNDHAWLEESQIEALQQQNLWDEIGAQIRLGEHHLADFESYLPFYLKHNLHLPRVSQRAKPYLHFIVSEVKKRNMPYEMALLPIIESGFQPHARSHQSAVGLWQFMPQTAHLYGLEQNWWYDGRQDVVQSTQAALTYLQKLYELNNNDWLLALASYNGGIGNVWKAVKKYQQKHPNDQAVDFWKIRGYLPKETQHYVPQLLAVSHLIKNRTQYKIELEPIENKPFFEVVKFDKQVALNAVASLSNTPSDLLTQLNPGYLRAATPPSGPFHIVLPLENHQQFQTRLGQTSLFDIQWQKHKVKPGDTLSEIAARYKTSTAAIQKLNRMKSHTIRVGKTLLIPIPQQHAVALVATPSTAEYRGPKFVHTVQSGDSLWSLARYYNTDIQTLCAWNQLDPNTPLTLGQSLEIRSNQYGQKIQYKLKKGESLWHVAKRYRVTTEELANSKQIQYCNPATS
jgi:membrane-bound lytic murein transglycosylase D